MRAKLVVGVLGLALPVALAVACRAPTQARVDIVTSAPCNELTGVALTVKSRPLAAEQAVAGRFVTATTRECESGRVGDIVLAPGEDTGAIVVVAGYKGVPATDCIPPAYANCIVARRSFSYVEHTTLRIPISLDPDCVNVPCDALSTCSKGKCVEAKVQCDGDQCNVQGSREVVPDAGGLLGDAAPPADGGGSDGSSPSDASVDSGDAGPQDGGATLPLLPPGIFKCTGSLPQCESMGVGLSLCPGGQSCFYSPSFADPYPVRCAAPTPPEGVKLCCAQSDCPGAACCAKPGRYPQCLPSSACAMSERVCTTAADCGAGFCMPGGPDVWSLCSPPQSPFSCSPLGVPQCPGACPGTVAGCWGVVPSASCEPVVVPGQTKFCCGPSDCNAGNAAIGGQCCGMAGVPQCTKTACPVGQTACTSNADCGGQLCGPPGPSGFRFCP